MGYGPRKDARPDADESGEDSPKRLYARAAFVFNVGQVDGYEGEAPAPRPDPTQRLAHVDAFLAATGIEFREGGSRAFYRRKNKATGEGGYVQMPPRNLFTGTATSTPTEAYELTRLHEAGHYAECRIMPRRPVYLRTGAPRSARHCGIIGVQLS